MEFTDTLASLALDFGLPGLAVAAFLAATLLPFSSEVALSAALASGIEPSHAVAAASLGNCLACLFNYSIGYVARERTEMKLQKGRVGRWALSKTDRYGWLSLWLAWLPIVGDPLTLVAGVARIRLWLFCTVVFSMRVGRYIVIALAFS